MEAGAARGRRKQADSGSLSFLVCLTWTRVSTGVFQRALSSEGDLSRWCAFTVQGLAWPSPPTPETLGTLSLDSVGPWRSEGFVTGLQDLGRESWGGAQTSLWGLAVSGRPPSPLQTLLVTTCPGQGPSGFLCWLTRMRPCDQGGPRSEWGRLSCISALFPPAHPFPPW